MPPREPDLFENLPLSKMKKQRSEIFAILEQQESLSNNYSVDVSEWTKHLTQPKVMNNEIQQHLLRLSDLS